MTFVVALLALIAGALISATAIFLFARGRLARDPYCQRWRKPSTTVGEDPFLLPSSVDAAHFQAMSRRFAIERTFLEAQIPVDVPLSEHGRMLHYEFLEPLHGAGDGGGLRGFGEDRASEIAQMIRLGWQLQSDHLLLMERVIDYIVAIHGNRYEDTLPLVRLEPAARFINQANVFPWVCIIETKDPGRYWRYLSEFRERLGIGVLFAKPGGYQPFGTCQVGAGDEGVVGGLLNCGGGPVAVTCGHVLSEECRSALLRSDPTMAGHPDAALLRVNQPCFQTPTNGTICRPAASEEIDSFVTNAARVAGRHPDVHPRNGTIEARVGAVPIGKHYHRFPHLLINPAASKFEALIGPAVCRPFSVPGDSGSWVFEAKTERWVGMVVGGRPLFYNSFAIEAEPLLQFFESSIAAGLLPGFTLPVVPVSFGR